MNSEVLNQIVENEMVVREPDKVLTQVPLKVSSHRASQVPSHVPVPILSPKRFSFGHALNRVVSGFFDLFDESKMVRRVGPSSRPLERHEFEKHEYRVPVRWL